MKWCNVAVRVAAGGCGLLIAGTIGCAGASGQSGFGDGDGGASGGGGDFGGDAGSFNGGGGADGGAATQGKTLLYAHTDTTLYQLDPENITAPMTTVGDFDCGSMTDLAVSKDGKLFAVSTTAVSPLTVSGGQVHCDATWSLPGSHGGSFYGLTMAPENTVAAQEVLIAANGAGQLFQIDPNSGAPTQVGTLGVDSSNGLPWALSGDIVFVANNGSPIGFATVRTCSGGASTCSKVDTLIEVDVHAIHPGTQSVLKTVRGAVQRGSWCTNPASPSTFGSMFGIVAYQDKVFGFSRSGDLVVMHNDDGSGCLVSAQPTMKFAGAGVTTTAPVTAPPPR